MTFLLPLFQWVCLLSVFIFSTINVSATPHNIPKLSVILQEPEAEQPILSKDFQTYFYNQTLDHFNFRKESYTIFKQKYVINHKYWGGAKERAPIFVYFGAEAPLDGDIPAIGFLTDNAPHFKALLVYIEHRYYGESNPFGSMEEAVNNEDGRGYFNSAQAIADYAEIILYLKKIFHAHESPVIVLGGSYGGMLASWFRLKYPHIALGALASSAPILYFDDISTQNGYHSVVTKDFKEVSESCYETVLNSWAEIDKIASQENGLSILSKRFNTCSQIKNAFELKDYLESMYDGAAQYNRPPRYPVTVVCGGIDGASEGSDILDRIFAGVVAYRGNRTCYNTTMAISQTSVGYGWQTCSEMVMPIGRGNDTMFQPAPFSMHEFIKECKSKYGVLPRPHWITTYYGGHDIKLVLKRFASNIIFSNGLRDPYSSGGVLENISDTVLAIHTPKGSHCLDILGANSTTDPYWLVKQRHLEVKIIKGWIRKYLYDLYAIKK